MCIKKYIYRYKQQNTIQPQDNDKMTYFETTKEHLPTTKEKIATEHVEAGNENALKTLEGRLKNSVLSD